MQVHNAVDFLPICCRQGRFVSKEFTFIFLAARLSMHYDILFPNYFGPFRPNSGLFWLHFALSMVYKQRHFAGDASWAG